MIASEESAASTPPTHFTKLGQLSLQHYASPVFEITSDESMDNYIIIIKKKKTGAL